MPEKLISCITLPPATILSVPIYNFAIANQGLAKMAMEDYYPCCWKTICKGCIYSFCAAGNIGKCPFCNSDRRGKTDEQEVEEMMKRVEANDPISICLLADSHYNGLNGFQQNHLIAIEKYTRAADLGRSKAHSHLADIYHKGGEFKKAKFHWEAAAMAGHEMARNNLGLMEYNNGNMERALKHWTIAASAGDYKAMHLLRACFEKGHVSRESIESTLAAYNNSCTEMRSKARDDYIHAITERS
jgi:TPR repeat protein